MYMYISRSIAISSLTHRELQTFFTHMVTIVEMKFYTSVTNFSAYNTYRGYIVCTSVKSKDRVRSCILELMSIFISLVRL